MSGSNGVAIVGGCGHVGLPLGLAFASRGLDVVLYDVNERSVAVVNEGTMPFDEPGAPEVLTEVIGSGRLRASSDPRVIGEVEHVVVVIGTPIDEHLNPNLNAVPAAIGEFASYLHDGQLLVLRSTVYPGVTALVERLIARARTRHRRRVLSRAHRRGQGDGRALRAPADRRRRAHRAPWSAPGSCSATSRTRSWSSSRRRPSSPSCSPTPGGTSSSRPPTSST